MGKAKLLKIFKSLKTRIFCIVILAGIIPCMILHFGILERYMDNAISVRTNEVQTQVKIIADHLLTYNYLFDNTNEVVNAELSQISNLYDGRVLVIDGNLKIIKDTYAISEGKTIISENIIKCFKDGVSTNHLEGRKYIEIIVPIEEKLADSSSRIVGVMLTSVSTDSIITSYEYIKSRAYLLEMCAIVVVFGMAYFLSRKLLKPFERITEAINEDMSAFWYVR